MILYRKYQPGGPMIVSSTNDPAYKSYADSLSVYTQGWDDIKKGIGYEMANEWSDERSPHAKYSEFLGNDDYDLLRKGVKAYIGRDRVKLVPWDKHSGEYKGVMSNSGGWNNTTQSYGEPWLRKGILPTQVMKSVAIMEENKLTSDLPVYKKPTQKVVVKGSKEWEAVKNQEVLKAAGLYKGKIDGIWGAKSQAAWDKYMEEPEEQKEKDAVQGAWDLIGGKPKEREVTIDDLYREKDEVRTYSTETEVTEEKVYTGRDRDGNPVYKIRRTRRKT